MRAACVNGKHPQRLELPTAGEHLKLLIYKIQRFISAKLSLFPFNTMNLPGRSSVGGRVGIVQTL